MSVVSVCKSESGNTIYWMQITRQDERERLAKIVAKRGWRIETTHSREWVFILQNPRARFKDPVSHSITKELAQELLIEAGINLGGVQTFDELPDIYRGAGNKPKSTPWNGNKGSIYDPDGPQNPHGAYTE